MYTMKSQIQKKWATYVGWDMLSVNFIFKKADRNVCNSEASSIKAELLQLNRTQFPSLGIFVSKKIENQKN